MSAMTIELEEAYNIICATDEDDVTPSLEVRIAAVIRERNSFRAENERLRIGLGHLIKNKGFLHPGDWEIAEAALSTKD